MSVGKATVPLGEEQYEVVKSSLKGLRAGDFSFLSGIPDFCQNVFDFRR